MARNVRTRWAVIVVLVAAAAGALAYLFYPRPLRVQVATVRVGPIADVVADQGQARVRRAYVVSAPVAGRLERLPLEVGDRVVAGRTVVAQLRPAPAAFLDTRARAEAQSSVAAAIAALTTAQAQATRLAADAARARADLERVEALDAKGFATRQALDNARAAATMAAQALRAGQAEVRGRVASVAAARAALIGPEASGDGVVTVRSPASGIVTSLAQQSERTVAAGAPLIEIGDTQGLEAQIEFLSQDAVRIRPGLRAEVFDWGGAQPVPAEVRLVEPHGFTKVSALGVEEQRVLVMLQFTGPPASWSGLAPGYRVWGRVYLREAPAAVLVPIGALVRDKGGWAVFRVEDGHARLRAVRIGAITDKAAEVLGGVRAGERLVEFPSDKVRDGVSVIADRPAR